MKLTSKPPKGKRIVSEIKEKIENGILREGTRLSTVREMVKVFDTSPSVIHNALQSLVKDDYIECRGHSGYYVRKTGNVSAAEPAAKNKTEQDKTIPFIIIHHNDLMWRRNYDDYDKIRQTQIKLELELNRRDPRFTFGIEQAAVLERYAEQVPEDIPLLQKLIKEGKLELSGAYSIQDLNMVSGEAILMCHIHGKKYYKEVWGVDTPVASLTDAFGLCSQMPQILSLAGFLYLIPGRLNNRDQKVLPFPSDGIFRWVGLDGTPFIVTAREGRHTGHGVGPDRGTMLTDNPSRIMRDLSNAQKTDVDSLLIYCTEEALITESVSAIVDSLNRKSSRKIAFRTAQSFFESAEKDDVPHIYGEFNPVFTGCFSTRISVKRDNRKCENQLFEEEWLDLYRNKKKDYTPAWKELYLIGFHDAICGCHADRAFVQLREKLDYVLKATAPGAPAAKAKQFSVACFNQKEGVQLASSPVPPAGIPSQKEGDSYLFEYDGALSARTFTASAKAVPAAKKCKAVFETDYYKADFTGGIAKIKNKHGENVFGNDFGEIVIRSDFGTMWQEAYMGYRVAGRDFTDEKVVSCTEGPVFFKVVTEGHIKEGPAADGNIGNHWPGFKSLKFKKEYIFPKHADHFTLKLTIDFRGCNTKTMIKFPTTVDCHSARPVYQVPFGSMERKPYFEVPQQEADTAQFLQTRDDYESCKGDWPALNWVDYSDWNKGLTVANNGTPGHELKSGNICVSLLRSGTQILDGCLMPQEGSFENGVHEFDFAFYAHSHDEISKAEQLGQMLNHPARAVADKLPEGTLLQFSDEAIAVSAVRKTKDGILVRAYETLGRYTTVSLSGTLLGKHHVYDAEADGTVLEKENTHELYFKPYEIRTFIIK